jgi:hypothetical protein
MADSGHDDFEAYLEQGVPLLPRISTLDRLEPPAELDRLVISEARHAIQASAPAPTFRIAKWALPVGLAATLIVSFSIMLDLGVRAKREKDAKEAPVAYTSPGVVSPSVRGEPAAPAPEASPPAPATDASRSPASPSPASPSAALANPYLFGAAHQATRTAPQPHLARSARIRASPPSEVTVTAPALRRQSEFTPSPMSATSASAATVVPRAPSTPPSSAAVPDVVGGLSTSSETSAPADLGSDAEHHLHPDPAAWLEDIGKLRAAGHVTEAEQEMKRFRDAYPAYPVPPQAAPAAGRAQ